MTKEQEDALYAQYGKLMVQAELLQTQIMPLKQQIAQILSKREPIEPEIVKEQ